MGIFDVPAKATAAVRALRADRLGEVTAYGPTLEHEMDAVLNPGKSRVRIFTLIGGILGCLTGFAFPIYTVRAWPLITGGKPIISIPPFVVIAFELTILFAALATLLGFLLLSGLPRLRKALPYDPRFSEDHWGVLVTSGSDRVDAVRARLTQAGA